MLQQGWYSWHAESSQTVSAIDRSLCQCCSGRIHPLTQSARCRNTSPLEAESEWCSLQTWRLLERSHQNSHRDTLRLGSPRVVKLASVVDASKSVQDTSGLQRAAGSHTDSPCIRPMPERATSSPVACMTGNHPSIFHCMVPTPSTMQSAPTTGKPCIQVVARQIMPRFQQITSSP